ncbi:hypothetical protein HMPREF9127_1261 [Parvimonas sp. oral taxon 393 str. F0440]|nr:hypothetical protein HMPREF9127_1261 [Parvimonas sp. oral taxon 393 str. F0440]
MTRGEQNLNLAQFPTIFFSFTILASVKTIKLFSEILNSLSLYSKNELKKIVPTSFFGALKVISKLFSPTSILLGKNLGLKNLTAHEYFFHHF